LTLSLAIAFNLALFVILAAPAAAQTQAAPYQPLSVKEKNFLIRMAREPMDALLKGRNPRDLTAPGSMRRLNQSQRLVMTLFLDGQLLARAWELRTPGVLQATTVSLAHRIMESPDVGRAPTYDEMSRIRVSMAVIHDLKDIANDKDAHAGQALVATIGMDFAVGLPSDLERGYTPFQLFSKACELSGLRNTAWLGDRATLYSGEVEEFFEN
jgi:AMMECR1 domain-containing protein